MAVVIVTQFRVNPGKTEAFGALLQELTPVVQRHGGRTRVLQSVFAGTDSLIITFLTETDDWASHGRYLDAVQADPAFQAVVAQLLAPDPAATTISNSVIQDLPQFMGG
jgi:hypothetical protein